MYFEAPSFAGSARGTSASEGAGSWRPPTLLIGTIEIDLPLDEAPAEAATGPEMFALADETAGTRPAVIIADLDRLKLDLQSLISNFKTIIAGV